MRLSEAGVQAAQRATSSVQEVIKVASTLMSTSITRNFIECISGLRRSQNGDHTRKSSWITTLYVEVPPKIASGPGETLYVHGPVHEGRRLCRSAMLEEDEYHSRGQMPILLPSFQFSFQSCLLPMVLSSHSSAAEIEAYTSGCRRPPQPPS